MDKDNQQIPGFGFDPGYEPSPLPQQPVPSTNTIFGLISDVNKGVLKHSDKSAAETLKECPVSQSVEQARAIAKKLSDISPQLTKQRVFQNAKTTIENIQKGIWKVPSAEQNKQGSSNIGFKVPTVTPMQKEADFSSHGHGVVQGQSQVANMSKQLGGPQGYGEEKKFVTSDYGNGTKQTGNFTRKEALDEIDRYRGPARSYIKNQTFEEARKKTEPFKSDFDRYYYGNETERIEISGKLHRADFRNDFDSEKDFASKQFQGHSQRQDDNSGRDYLSRENSRRDYKGMSDTGSRVDYRSDMDNPQRVRNDYYQRPGNDNYGRPTYEIYQSGSRDSQSDSQRHRNENPQRSENDNYERPGNEDYRSGADSYQNDDYQSNEKDKNYRYRREYGHVEEYDPEKWEYSRTKRGSGANDKSIKSGSYGNMLANEKSSADEKTPYHSDYDLYLKDTRGRNMETDHERFDSRRGNSQERPDNSRNNSQSPTVFDYGHTMYSRNEEVMSYRSSRSMDEQDQQFDDNRYRYERENRDANRNRGSGSRNRETERDSYYDKRGEQHYNRQDKSGRDYYNDYYDRGRDEKYDYINEEYGEDMANMEEFPEEMEQVDSKSQDGGMLYEDYLFGDDDYEGEEKTEMARRSKEYGGKHFVNEMDKKKNVEVKMKRMKEEKYDSDRNSGSDRRDTGSRGVDQRSDRMRNKDNFDERMVDRGFEKTGRNLPITDDQKAQVEKPFGEVKMSIPLQIPLSTGVSVQQVSPLMGVPVQVPPPTGVPRQGPTSTVVLGKGPTSTRVPGQVPPPTGVLGQVPPPTSFPGQVPPPSGVPGQGPPPSRVPVQVPPPPTSAPEVPVTLTTFIPPPGIICKDCNVTCMDQEIYNAHLKSNVHTLTLQRKAQELFQMDSRKSRFDVDSTGKPLKASVLPPSTMITGIPTQTLAKPTAGTQLGRNVFSGDASPEITDRHDSPTRYRSRSDSGVQVIPPKPLGPLETRSVQCTWLILQWRTRHEDEEALIDKYVVEYRNAREIRWVRVGATIKHEFEVNGLQEGTDYLFRVYTTNRDERSEYLESVLVTTKKRRDSPEWGRRIPGRERERDRGRRSSRERDRKSSREKNRIHSREGDRKVERDRTNSREGERKVERDRTHSREGDRKPVGNRKITTVRKRVVDRKSSRETGRAGRDSKQMKSKDVKSVKKTSSTDNKQKKTGKPGNKEEKLKEESQNAEKKTEENQEKMEVDKSEEANQEEVECLLYRELPSYVNEPMLGLDNIYEIRSYLQKSPPRYVCKLCNNKGSHKIIVKHIIGFPHKLNYFKKHNPEVYDIINVIALKKQQVERANYEAKLEEDRIGRGSVKVMMMLNPQDNNGKVVYRDPIPVKAPAPQRKKETGEAPVSDDGSYQSQFETLYNEAVETGTLSDTTLIGLDYIKEILHPRMEKEPKYTCSLCSVICHNTTILSHLVGKKHRFNYLKVYHQDVFEMINNAKGQKHQLLMDKIKELAAEDGTGTIKTKVGRNERMWRDKASKAEEAQAQAEAEAQSREEDEGNLEEPQPENQGQAAGESTSSRTVQAIKFGIKKTESQPTNVKPINVLDQEQVVPKHKEAFDWNKENSLLQSKIHNETIIKSSRKSKFLNVYSEFFKRYPVIGIQWVTEFQKQDVKQEPWYMCSMCQQKLQWKNILDHVTSNLHRLNYMKKSDYRQMYNAVYHAIKKDKQSARPLIEQYSKEIAGIEGLPTEMEVMLELNVNTEAFKSVAKVQENVKAHASASSSSQPTSIQINIASTSLSGAKIQGDITTTVQAASEPRSTATYLSSAPTQQVAAQNTSQDLQVVSQVQPYNFQTPQSVQAQIQPAVQPQIQHPPIRAPLIRPPPLYPPPAAVIPNMTIPPPSMQSCQVQRFPVATASPQLIPYLSSANAPVTESSTTVSAVRYFAPSVGNIPAAQGGQMPFMPVPVDLNSASVRRPLLPGPGLRPPLASVPAFRPPHLPQQPLVGRILPQIPEQTQLAMPVSVQQPLIQGQPPRLQIHSGIQPPFSNAPVISSAPPVLMSDAQQAPVQEASSSLIGHKPPPWQMKTSTPQMQPPTGSSYYDSSSQIGFSLSPNLTDSKEMPEVNSRTQVSVRDKAVGVSETVDTSVYSNEKNEKQDYDHKRPSHATSEKDDIVSKKYQPNSDFDYRTSRNVLRETDRGIKRYGRGSGYSDRNKRMRNGDRVNTINTEKRVSSPQRSSFYGRLSQESDNRRNRDLRTGDRRDRRRSRSPQRYDRRRSPPRRRQRDDNFGNRPDRFSRRSDHLSSPGRDRHREKHEERREQSYHSDKQIPTDDFNMPLNEKKVDDLVRMYSDRVDEDYDKLMENETEYEDLNDNRLDGGRKGYADYERNDEKYYDEGGMQQNYYDREKFHSGRNFSDGLNEHDETSRFDSGHTYRYDGGPDSEFRDLSNNYDQNSRRNANRNKSSRESDFIERAHVSENTRGRKDDMQRVDRHRDRFEQQEHFFMREENRKGEFGSAEGWQEDVREDTWGQREYRRNQNERQTYSREERQRTDTFNIRRDDNSGTPVYRQRYGDDDRMMYDGNLTEYDGLPDPSREEIDELLRKANEVITQPCDEYIDYEDEVPPEHTGHQESSLAYMTGNSGHGGYRGRGGPRTGR